MTEFWNRGITVFQDKIKKILDMEDIISRDLVGELEDLKHGNKGCGTCGSATSCSSKNS